jgi:hypothetical protein
VKPKWSNKQLIIDYKKTFSTDSGKRVLADMRKKCPFLCETLAKGGVIDKDRLLFVEGQRSVVWYIYRMLHRDPNQEAPTRAINEGE